VDQQPRAGRSIPSHAAQNGKRASCFRSEFVVSQHWAGAPAISVAETKDAFEVTVELPGVDEKDIKVSLDENQLVISGEKKAESMKEEKEWHVEERSYGSFYRSMFLPFEPEEGAVEAHFDKGALHLTIKKPAKAVKTTKTIDIKTGAPPSAPPVSNKPAAPSKAA
jgi:HSP20 family protein